MKQLETKVVKIGENEFYIKPFGAFIASNLSAEVASVVAPLVTGIIPLFTEKGDIDIADVEIEKIVPGLSSAFMSLSGDKMEELLKKLLVVNRNVSVKYYDEKGREQSDVLTYDLANELFCGSVDEMFILAYHVIAMNFGGFFGKASSLFGKDISALKKKETK